MDLATCTSDFELFVTKFNGTNFGQFREQMLNALTHLGQDLPLQGMDARPESMSDDEWEDLDELARSTIRLHLDISVYSMFLDACTARDLWQQLCDTFGTDESREMPRARGRARRHRDMVCWHCGHAGHFRRRCFRRMRQCQRQRRHDALALIDVGADVAYEATYDGDVTFASSVTPDFLMSFDGTLPSQLVLDAVAVFHVTPCREWFSTYASGMLGCVRLADGSAHDIVGAGEIRLSLPSGALFVLRDVRHVPSLSQSLISVRQLRDSGCDVVLREHSFRMHRRSLVIARGARVGTIYSMHVRHVRDGMVFVSTQPCVETRRVSFMDELQDTLLVVEQSEPVVHSFYDVSHTDGEFSGDARLEQSLGDVTGEPETDALFFDASESFEIGSDLMSAVQDMSAVELAIAAIERLCSSESQQWESDCSGADSSVLQSFSDMPLPDVDTVMHGQVVPEDADSAEIVDRDRLTEIARVSSLFGALMYEMLISRPDIAAAVGAFAAELIGHSVADSGSEHRGGLQVLEHYLQEVCPRSGSVGYTEAELPTTSFAGLHCGGQPDAHYFRQPVGIG